MKTSDLTKKTQAIPHKPGIYLFKNRNSRKLYIGKANDLKKRLSSYTRANDSRILKMLELAEKIEIYPTGSDIEALILESQFIKKYRPQFNIMLRDDKQYFFVGFSGEKLPRVFLTHQPMTAKGLWPMAYGKGRKIKNPYAISYPPYAGFLGPFTDGAILKSVLRFLRNTFPHCTCKEKHNVPCLNYHIGKCLGFCCLKQPNLSLRLTTYDLQQYKKNIRAIKDILSGRKIPLILKLEKEMKDAAQKGNLEKAIELRSKLENLKRIFENAAVIKNLKLRIENSETAQKSNATLGELQKLLKLEHLPSRIEGYDIANIQGRYASGAMVVFENGNPRKDFYRKFNIRRKEGEPNDTAMLKEILTRRLQHDEWLLPELIIVDGGKGQVGAVIAVLQQEAKDIVVVGLTKDQNHRGDHIFISNRKEPVNLTALKPKVRNLILAVDAEAHRFAISHYRQRHLKEMLTH